MLSLMKKNKQKTLRKKETLPNKQKRLHKQLRLSFLCKCLDSERNTLNIIGHTQLY